MDSEDILTSRELRERGGGVDGTSSLSMGIAPPALISTSCSETFSRAANAKRPFESRESRVASPSNKEFLAFLMACSMASILPLSIPGK